VYLHSLTQNLDPQFSLIKNNNCLISRSPTHIQNNLGKITISPFSFYNIQLPRGRPSEINGL